MKKSRKLVLKKEKITSLSQSEMTNIGGGDPTQRSTRNDYTCNLCTSVSICSTWACDPGGTRR